jgi:integrase
MTTLPEAMKGPAGLVTLSGPDSRGYFRMRWFEPVHGVKQERSTSATRSIEEAERRVLAKEEELLRGATDRTRRRLSDAIVYWLDPATPRPRHRPWSKSRLEMAQRYAKYYLIPQLGSIRCMDLARHHIQEVVNLAPSLGEGKRVREECVSLLTALRNGDWLLTSQVIDLAGVWWHGTCDDDDDADGQQFALQFVVPAKRPTHQQVKDLRIAADSRARLVSWRGLAIELAAYSGLRLSELLGLRPTDIDLDKRQIHVEWQVHRGQRKRPKGRRRRITVFPTTTPTGYPLLDALRRRCGQVEPDALLFGTASGKPMSPSNWHRDVFEHAALAAGWPSRMRDRVTVTGKVRERAFDLTWHSLRHTFATVALDEWGVPITKVALLCGHASRAVTERLYISATHDALDEVAALIS